jgi:transcriptional regulator with XRE-family HTH domain
MDMRKLVGWNFARLRQAKRFTQERFAEASGFTQQYVSGLENGRSDPTVVTFYHLANALGVSRVELVTPDDEAPRDGAKPTKRKSGGGRSANRQRGFPQYRSPTLIKPFAPYGRSPAGQCVRTRLTDVIFSKALLLSDPRSAGRAGNASSAAETLRLGSRG